jgi:hypothetical protein
VILLLFASGDVIWYPKSMTREELAEQLSILLSFYAKFDFLDFKEGSDKEPGDYDVVIDLGWMVKTDEGGPWRRLTLTPEGEAIIERILGATGVALTL